MSFLKVSIIVPVYNAQQYLKRCIDSILNQDYNNIEVILINDGSTDNSAQIIGLYNDERIVLINKENGGVSEARNCGISKSSGELVCFVDADDTIEKNYISLMVDIIQKEKCDLVCCGYNYIDTDDEVMGGFPGQKEKLHFDGSGFISKEKFYSGMLLHGSIGSTLWNKIFRRRLLEGMTLKKQISIGEDLLFLSEYVSKCSDIYFIEDKLYNYRVNYEGAMKQIRISDHFDPKWLSEWMAICEFEKKYYIYDPTLSKILEYKKAVIANKLLSKAKAMSFNDEICDDMKVFVKAYRLNSLGNIYLNWKIKVKLFLSIY